MMSDRIVARLRKSELEEVVVAIRNYGGADFVDIRTFFGARNQETKPTRKGVTIPFALYSEFRRSIGLLDTEMADGGWT
jgi:hypothetical protein